MPTEALLSAQGAVVDDYAVFVETPVPPGVSPTSRRRGSTSRSGAAPPTRIATLIATRHRAVAARVRGRERRAPPLGERDNDDVPGKSHERRQGVGVERLSRKRPGIRCPAPSRRSCRISALGVVRYESRLVAERLHGRHPAARGYSVHYQILNWRDPRNVRYARAWEAARTAARPCSRPG